MPYDEMFRRMASIDGSALGLWTFADFRGYMGEVEQSDLDNHGVRFTHVVLPSVDPDYVMGSKACHPLIETLSSICSLSWLEDRYFE